MLNKVLSGITLTLSALTLATAAQAEYPERNIQGVIPWGAGGATDNVMRSLTPYVEKELGTKIILNNRPGGTAVIGSSYVLRSRPDGYTLLLGAENPQLYPVLGVADFDYGDFTPINIIGQNVVVIATHPDSRWDSLDALLAEAREKPDTLRMGSTGAGGLPSTVHAMMNAVAPFKTREVTFGGDGPGITALLGGHIDFMSLGLAAAKEMIRTGKLKALAIVSPEALPDLPDVPPVTDALPELKAYLPWGPFWGVWVRKETPQAVREQLTEAYAKAVGSPEFGKFLENFGAQRLNLQGEKATEYLNQWQSVTAWSMYKAGATQVSPETHGIPKP